MCFNDTYERKKHPREAPLTYSVRTVQRTIQDIDWIRFKKISAGPKLLPRHLLQRQLWAHAVASMTDVEWCQVVFSDEKKWNLDGPDGMRYQWVNTRVPEPLNVRRHSGGGSVMIWGAFRGSEKSEIKFLVGRQDAAAYIDTMRTHLQPFIDNETQIFQQDNAPIYNASATMD
jgi:hypothetical protein